MFLDVLHTGGGNINVSGDVWFQAGNYMHAGTSHIESTSETNVDALCK